MAFVSFPRDVALRGVQWSAPFDTAQANRSEFTGGRQVVALPGGGRWSASGEFVPMIGQDSSLQVRAFLSQLRGGLNHFALPAWEKRFSNVLPLTAPPQTIATAARVDVTGRTLTKTVSANVWDGQASSTGFLSGGCILHFRAGKVAQDFAIGINTDPSTDFNVTSIDHAIHPTSEGFVRIWESGTPVMDGGIYSPEDLFSIEYTNSAVNYYQNGGLLRTVAKASGINFYFDSSFFTLNSFATDVAFTARTLLSAGATAITLRGFDLNAQAVVLGGQFLVALFSGGGAQLLTAKYDADSDGSGLATIQLDAPLRQAAYAVVTDYPFAHMALADQGGWSVDPGQIYGAGFTAEEAW